MRAILFVVGFMILSGCATSNYGQGCRDGLHEAFIGDYTEWQDQLCDKLENKHDAELQQYHQDVMEARGGGVRNR